MIIGTAFSTLQLHAKGSKTFCAGLAVSEERLIRDGEIKRKHHGQVRLDVGKQGIKPLSKSLDARQVARVEDRMNGPEHGVVRRDYLPNYRVWEIA
nr:hypothetical protein [Prosthecobacter debontii]